MTLLALLLFFSDPAELLKKDPQAIWIAVDQEVVDMPLFSLGKGTVTNFKDVGGEGFTMILSATCQICKDAYPLLSILGNDHPTQVLFAGTPDQVRAFLKEQHEDRLEHVYLVKPQDLNKYNIRTVPAILGHADNRLTMAMHGPMDVADAEQLQRLHKTRSRTKRKQ